MAKISPVSIKYMVHASFKSEGPLEKPDVIGAIFGQTEGLLGADLELRELQKEGKIGRIEVDLETVDGKSVGEIQVPTALDKSETTLIAAALETIDRIGPTEAEIKILKIEDVRGGKRDFILERAKKLLEGLETGGEVSGMSKTLKQESRAAKIQEYGEEKLPAGDLSGNEVTIVEGRADVVNMLKNRVNNVVGMNGTKLPKEISRLGEIKELTLFVDGDRGGKLIAKNVIDNAKIVYVAVAPDGKEVEELEGKEILLALRRKVKTSEYLRKEGSNGYRGYKGNSEVKEVKKVEFKGDLKKAIREAYSKVEGSKAALLLDGEMDVIRKVGAREVAKSVLGSRTQIFGIVIDGSATGTVIKACDEKGVQVLGAKNFTNISGAKVELVSL
jgi:DNA primase